MYKFLQLLASWWRVTRKQIPMVWHISWMAWSCTCSEMDSCARMFASPPACWYRNKLQAQGLCLLSLNQEAGMTPWPTRLGSWNWLVILPQDPQQAMPEAKAIAQNRYTFEVLSFFGLWLNLHLLLVHSLKVLLKGPRNQVLQVLWTSLQIQRLDEKLLTMNPTHQVQELDFHHFFWGWRWGWFAHSPCSSNTNFDLDWHFTSVAAHVHRIWNVPRAWLLSWRILIGFSTKRHHLYDELGFICVVMCSVFVYVCSIYV